MATIGECVDAYLVRANTSEKKQRLAREWMEAAACRNRDIRLMTSPKSALDSNEVAVRERIKERTRDFVHRYFDDRPNVVRFLDELFVGIGAVGSETIRKECLAFENIYSKEEISVLLLKHLQPTPGRNRNTHKDIADYFLTTDRTIGGYIRAMLPMTDSKDDARVLGQAVKMDPVRGTNIPKSTTHPLFLPLNMVELYTLVDILARHVDDEVEGRIVKRILASMLSQTTHYAERRLSRNPRYNRVSALVSPLHRHSDPGEAVVFHEKERVRAVVRYMEDDEEKTCSGYITRDLDDKTLINVKDHGLVVRIPYRDIISMESLRE